MVILTATALFTQTTPNDQTVHVACIGDSITEGSDYPNQLWMNLGANYTVGNFGYHGTTIALDALTPYMHEQVFQEAKKFQPKIVIIMLGTNDAAPENQAYHAFFVSDYLQLVREIQSLASKPEVWLVKPPPIWHNGTGLSTTFFTENIIPAIDQVAKETNLPIIDAYTALKNNSNSFPDGVHPTDDGAKLIADVVYQALKNQ